MKAIIPVIRRTMLAERHRRLAAKVDHYQQSWSRDEIEAIQVRRFNQVWAYSLAQVPFYRAWRREHSLPDRISRTADLADFPPLGKSTLSKYRDQIFDDERIVGAYVTGGSTGDPTRFPRGPGETDVNWVNSYLARSWSGIAPLVPTVHVWGHAHLFGSGYRRRVNQLRRGLADRASGITRLSSYDLTERALHAHYQVLRRQDPLVISGYASALFRLARYIERNRLDLGSQERLRAVVLCAETTSDSDLEVIRRVFPAPAVIEYGANETGVIAMSAGATRPLRVLWDSFVCRVRDDGELLVSTLTSPRLFPLVNYAIDDCVTPADIRDGTALTFQAVTGRRQDVVRVDSTRGVLELSAVLPVAILKARPGVVGVQFRQVRPDRLTIFVQCDVPADAGDIRDYFIGQLSREHPDLISESVELELVSAQVTTRAGKSALFIP